MRISNVFLYSILFTVMFIGCGASGTCNDIDETNDNNLSSSSVAPIIVERGPVFMATVSDADGNQAVNDNLGFSNIYRFDSQPVYPITVSGGYIDVNRNDKLDSNDTKLDITMLSYSNIVSPLTTLVENNTTLINYLTEHYDINQAQIFNTVPSETSITSLILANVGYKALKYGYPIGSEEFNQTLDEVNLIYLENFQAITDLNQLASLIEEEVIKEIILQTETTPTETTPTETTPTETTPTETTPTETTPTETTPTETTPTETTPTETTPTETTPTETTPTETTPTETTPTETTPTETTPTETTPTETTPTETTPTETTTLTQEELELINSTLSTHEVVSNNDNETSFIKEYSATDSIQNIWNLVFKIPANKDIDSFDIGTHIVRSAPEVIGDILIQGISIKDNQVTNIDSINVFGKKVSGTTGSIGYDSTHDITQNAVALIQGESLLVKFGYIMENQTIVSGESFKRVADYNLSVYASNIDINGSTISEDYTLQLTYNKFHTFPQGTQKINGLIKIGE